jgi:hypothetical protein
MRRLLFGIVWLAGHLIWPSSSSAENLQDKYSIEVVISGVDGSLSHGKQVCAKEARCQVSIGEEFWAYSLQTNGNISFELFGPYVGAGNIECCGINGSSSRSIQISRGTSMFSGDLYYMRRWDSDNLSYFVSVKFGRIYIAAGK